MAVQLTPEQQAYWKDMSENLDKHAEKFRQEMMALLEKEGRAALEKKLKGISETIQAMVENKFDYMLIERKWFVAKERVLKEILQV